MVEEDKILSLFQYLIKILIQVQVSTMLKINILLNNIQLDLKLLFLLYFKIIKYQGQDHVKIIFDKLDQLETMGKDGKYLTSKNKNNISYKIHSSPDK